MVLLREVLVLRVSSLSIPAVRKNFGKEGECYDRRDHHDPDTPVAWLPRPTAGKGSWPGVIVLHDAAGMSNDLRHRADWLAEAGYLAVAPNLFSWRRKLVCLRAAFRDVHAGRGQTFVGSFVGRDRNLRGAAQKLNRVLEALGVEYDVEKNWEHIETFPGKIESASRGLAGTLSW
jgi:Dienelactone hydrolase family